MPGRIALDFAHMRLYVVTSKNTTSRLAWPLRYEVSDMAESIKCPQCGLINPSSAERCDCGYDFVTRTTDRSEPEMEDKPALRGIGGWLLLFCIGTTIVNPLISTALAAQPNLGVVPRIFYLLFAGFSFYTGISLWRVRTNALRLVAVYFITALAIGALWVMESVVKWPTAGGSNASAGGSVLGTLVWLLYFHRSERIRGTFGRNL